MSGRKARLVRGNIAYLEKTYRAGDILPDEIAERQVEKGKAHWIEVREEDADDELDILKEMAKEAGIPYYWNMKKQTLQRRLKRLNEV